MTAELITTTANVALTLSFLVALIFGIMQVRTAERDRRERFSLEALRNFQTREFAELIQYIAEGKVPSTRSEMRALSTAEQVMFIQFSQQMESLGLLVAVGLIDIGLMDRTLGSFVTTSWEKYKPMFLDLREKTPDPYLGEYFQWLAEKIEVQMRENPRKPFYEISKS